MRKTSFPALYCRELCSEFDTISLFPHIGEAFEGSNKSIIFELKPMPDKPSFFIIFTLL